MKTADGSFHQCYSGQAVVDCVAQVIVVAELSDQAADQGQLQPALEQLDENLEAIGVKLPDGAVLTADAGYFSDLYQWVASRAWHAEMLLSAG
jgi:hypothetical protein